VGVGVVVVAVVVVYMWVLLLPPVAALIFGSFAFSRAFADRSNAAVGGDEDDDASKIELGLVGGGQAHLDELEDIEDAVLSDVLSWLDDAAERLDLTRPEVVRLNNSTYLKLNSNKIELLVWLAGEAYLGPFPRVSLSSNVKHSGVSFKRTQICMEKAILEIRNCV